MRRPRARRALVALLVVVGLSATTAGCVSMPSGGPVLPYPATQGADTQNQSNYYQFVPSPPLQNGSPAQIVEGFLAASASFAGQQQVAREYLTSRASQQWKPGWSAVVYKNGPTVGSARQTAGKNTASVTVSGSPQATLTSREGYAVASETKTKTFRYDLIKDRDGQWRISNAHDNPLLLTSTEFGADYQLADLYFFDPSWRYLVPDPVYVPLQATQGALVNGLVQDLINQPADWLGEASPPGTATVTAFPKHTALQGAVTVDGGTASVNLTGTGLSRASPTMEERISAQLLCTLTGACQGQQQQVKSIALSIDGKPFYPPGASPGNPVQHQAAYQPAASSQAHGLYYLTAGGELELLPSPQDNKPVTLASIGAGYSSLAVSPDGKYLAAVKNGDLYTGKVGQAVLASRGLGAGITSLSWDDGDNLWVIDSGDVFVVGAVPSKPATPPVSVGVSSSANTSCGSTPGDVTALRVAPDGVRVAIVYGGVQQTLAFGAIAKSGPASQPVINITLSPFFVCKASGAFTSLSWYGADDVIALGQPDNTVTDYPVNGGTATTMDGPQDTTSITANPGWGLIAAGRGTVSSAASMSSAWTGLESGLSPTFPG
ncbi:MAG TPA: LpqB family beta-propeller domain-containing protein [Trebonia sp.]|nr:LpqB family beta-propeller domain-containing protein [Trebonia sp.]